MDKWILYNITLVQNWTSFCGEYEQSGHKVSSGQWILTILFSLLYVNMLGWCQLCSCNAIHVIKIMNSGYMCFVSGKNPLVTISLLLLNYRWMPWLESLCPNQIFQNSSWDCDVELNQNLTKFSAFHKAYNCDVRKKLSGTYYVFN